MAVERQWKRREWINGRADESEEGRWWGKLGQEKGKQTGKTMKEKGSPMERVVITYYKVSREGERDWGHCKNYTKLWSSQILYKKLKSRIDHITQLNQMQPGALICSWKQKTKLSHTMIAYVSSCSSVLLASSDWRHFYLFFLTVDV